MFTSRRKPKRIAREQPDAQNEEVEENEPVVVRKPGATKPKSKLRISFQPDQLSEQSPSKDEATSTTTKRLGPSAASQTKLPSRLEVTDRQNDSSSSYSKDVLDELRSATPSTPQDLQIVGNDEDGESLAIDVASKFGTATMSTRPSTTIPSAAEIQERKERRARLAREHNSAANISGPDENFIPLDGYDSDGEFKPQRMQVGLFHNSGNGDGSEKNTRLVRDDEDFGEGFDEFVEDAGRVTLSRKGLREQNKQERQAMQEMIEQAEGSEDEESDSETERNYAFEAAQTQHGMDGVTSSSYRQHTAEKNRPRQPKEITPVPKLATALARLRESVQRIEMEKSRLEKRRADIRLERVDIKASQDHIQQSLEEAGRELEQLHLSEPPPPTSTIVDHVTQQRGLENVGDHIS